MERLTSYGEWKTGDAVEVTPECRIEVCRGRKGTLEYVYAPQPEFGNPAEFIIWVDNVCRPMGEGEFRRASPEPAYRT